MQDSISLNFYIASNPDWQQNSQDGINSMTVPIMAAQHPIILLRQLLNGSAHTVYEQERNEYPTLLQHCRNIQ